jgi:hypothetical protein
VITDIQESERLRHWSFNSASVKVVRTRHLCMSLQISDNESPSQRNTRLSLDVAGSRHLVEWRSDRVLVFWGMDKTCTDTKRGDSLHHQGKEGSLIMSFLPGALRLSRVCWYIPSCCIVGWCKKKYYRGTTAESYVVMSFFYSLLLLVGVIVEHPSRKSLLAMIGTAGPVCLGHFTISPLQY